MEDRKGVKVLPPTAAREEKEAMAWNISMSGALSRMLMYGSVGVASHFVLLKTSKFYQSSMVTPAVKAFFVSSFFVAGYWIGGEESLRDYARAQSHHDNDATMQERRAMRKEEKEAAAAAAAAAAASAKNDLDWGEAEAETKKKKH